MATVDVAGGYFHSTIGAIRSVTIPERRTWRVNAVLAEEGRRPGDTYDNNNTDLSVLYLGPC